MKRAILFFGLFLLGVLAGVGLDRYWSEPEPAPPVKTAGHGQDPSGS